MKRRIGFFLALSLCLSLCACGKKEEAVTLSLGDTFSKDGVSFTLHDFCLAEETNGSTYDPNQINGNSWVPNDGYIFGYLNYTIENGGKEKFSHFMDIDISLEYGDGYTYGSEMTDYKVSCTDFDSYDLDVDPLMSKTYHHIISNCPASIVPTASDIAIVVTIDHTTARFVIPAADITVNEGQTEPEEEVEEIEFTEADAQTEQLVRTALDGAKYGWQNGNIQCTLTFDKTSVKLTQKLAGVNYAFSGAYTVGTELLKVNYGGGDVYYAWSIAEGQIQLQLVD